VLCHEEWGTQQAGEQLSREPGYMSCEVTLASEEGYSVRSEGSGLCNTVPSTKRGKKSTLANNKIICR